MKVTPSSSVDGSKRSDSFEHLVYNDAEVNRLCREIKKEIEAILAKYRGA